MLSSHVNRGYIKVPEIGASKYDATGVRSLNIARIVGMKIIDEVDRTFINVDLNSVIYNFENAIDYIASKESSYLKDIYVALTDEQPESDSTAQLVQSLKDYAETRGALLSTTFYRALHLFMIKNPLWFPLYIGERAENNNVLSSNSNIGVSSDFDFSQF